MTTRDVVRAYLTEWTIGDLERVRRLLAEDAAVECNLSGPGDAGLADELT